MITVKSYFVLKYLYPDIDPILIGGKENYQKVLDEVCRVIIDGCIANASGAFEWDWCVDETNIS